MTYNVKRANKTVKNKMLYYRAVKTLNDMIFKKANTLSVLTCILEFRIPPCTKE